MNTKLKPYVNDTVLVQLRHAYQLVVRQGNKPEPMRIGQEVFDGKGNPVMKDGKPVKEYQFVQVSILVGVVCARGELFVLQYLDPVSETKIDVDVADDLIAYVSKLSEQRVALVG